MIKNLYQFTSVMCIAILACNSLFISNSFAQQKRIDLLKIPNVSKEQIICFALYTVHDSVLKLTAQLYPIKQNDDRNVRLEIKENGMWKQIAETEVIEDGWTAPFRVNNWDMTKDIEYRVVHGTSAFYEGTIKKDPIDKDEIVVAAFTGNSINPAHGGDIPKKDIIENIKKIKPDLLFFSGDQVYDHNRHYAAWLKFGRDFGEIIRNIPTITIPDDHDVGQANLWGEEGIQSNTGAGHDGGYFKPLTYVMEAQRAQTSHLPDPYDPTPIKRGLPVYYTDFTIGKVDFAVIEDRKFKTGPEGVIPQQGPRPDHIRNPEYDPKTVDVEEAQLLGNRQLKFLYEWGQDWEDVNMKAVLSQTIFCGGAHIHGKIGGRLHADLDSNGWPQTGRNKALAEIRRCFAIHIAGDQHLGSIFHHGIDDWNDANYSFCVPSIANLYLRWWDPLLPGKNHKSGMPEYTGEHLDGFGNKLTCWAAANPDKNPNGGGKLTTRAAGFGVVRFNTKTREITMECWPRNVDISDPDTTQYEGWPKTIHQNENYARNAIAKLPTLEISGQEDTVVQIIDDTNNKTVYTIRIQGNTFTPNVFKEGSYTIKVGESDEHAVFKGVNSIGLDEEKTIKVSLNDIEKQKIKNFSKNNTHISHIYKTIDNRELQLHLHFPPGWKESDQRPAIIFFFGGGWNGGTINQFKYQADYFASRGIVAARADYRVKSRDDVTPDQCVVDARSAVRWLRKNAVNLGIDPNQLITSGGSAGGHLAACQIIEDSVDDDQIEISASTVPQAMVLYNPALDFTTRKDLLNRIGNDVMLAKKISPNQHLNQYTPPTIQIWGSEDKQERLAQWDIFKKNAKTAGVHVEAYIAEGEGHGFFNTSPWLEKTTYAADEFLESLGYLEGKPTVVIPKE